MQGTNAWDSKEFGGQPQFLLSNTGIQTLNYRYSLGCLRWARVNRSDSVQYIGWVLCYQDGKPITYADNSQPGSISVSASGTYMTL
jgi:hypothetical protein